MCVLIGEVLPSPMVGVRVLMFVSLTLVLGWWILFRNVARGLQKQGICSLLKTTAEGGCGRSSVQAEAGSA